MNATATVKGRAIEDLILIAHAHNQAWMEQFALSHGILPETITDGVATLLRHEEQRTREADPMPLSGLRIQTTKLLHDIRRQVEGALGTLSGKSEAQPHKRRMSAKGRAAIRRAARARWAKKASEENNARKVPHRISAKGMRAIQKAQKLRRAREKQARMLLHQGGKKAA